MQITHVGKPENLNLPFFAYGSHKPGQIAFHQIKDDIMGIPPMKRADYEMKYRDGLPVLVGEKSDESKTIGFLIYFDDSDDAYFHIGRSEPIDLYEWKVIEVDGIEANALVGVEISKGCIEDDGFVSVYDFRNDSFFSYAKELIRDCFSEYKDKEDINMRDFFILQMHYMLLWSIIERFCILKYGYYLIGSNQFNFAKEKVFIEKLKGIDRDDTIYSSDTLTEKRLDPNDYESISYYYTIRCNVVHKGKTVKDEDMLKLKKAFVELYGLFEEVYLDSLNKCDAEHGRLYG